MNVDVRRLFHALVDLPPGERERVLNSQRIDPDIRAEVESLLHFDTEDEQCLANYVSAAADEMLSSADTLGDVRCGPYRLVRLLGSGGMGSVYLAERSDGELQQRVAIKLLRTDGHHPDWNARFLKERQLLASLNHPSIVHVFDAGHTEHARPYLVMEYVAGTPIDGTAAKLDERGRLTLFLRVCDGVSHAHGHLIVHRDLKPSNILVDDSGQPKILDFGIAKLLDDAGENTQGGDRLLTLNYASPEQLAGVSQTTATDVYSLGAVLYKMLTGRSPHEDAGTSRALEVAAGTREIPDASRFNPKLPADLDYILRKALRHEPAERYASVEAFAADVRALLDSRPVQARAGDRWYRSRKFIRRHWMPVTAAAVVIAGLSTGLVVANRARVAAERRFGQLRQLSNAVFDFDGAIRRLPGSIQARKRLITVSLAYLEGLSVDARGNLDLAMEVARGYWRVARVQGVPNEFNLGQFGEAEKNLRRAEELLQPVLLSHPRDHNALRLAANVSVDRMILAESERRNADAEVYALQGAERLDAFGRLGDASDSEQIEICASYTNIALAHVNMHRYAEAVPYAQKAVEIARKNPSAPRPVAQGLSVLANARRFQGDLDGAVTAIREARAIVDQTASSRIEDRLYDVYGVLLREGEILGEDGGVNAGRPADAIEPLQAAFDMTEQVAVASPADSTSRSRLGTAGRTLGDLLRSQDPQRALAIYDLAIRRLREIPNNLKARRDLAITLADSSYPLLALHRSAEAGRRTDQALKILQETKDYPAARIELDREQYPVLSAKADYEAETGNPERALVLYEQLLQAVISSNVDPLGDLRDAPRMSRLYEKLSGLYRRTGDTANADNMASRRLELWRQWDGKIPGNSFVRRQLDVASTRARSAIAFREPPLNIDARRVRVH